MTDRSKAMAVDVLNANVPALAPPTVVALGYQLTDFLRSVADAGTGVDWGCGGGEFDLEVIIDGIRHVVTVKTAKKADR